MTEGSTFVNIPRGGGDPVELLLGQVRTVATGYEVLGEMGRSERGSVVYLARDAETRHLVALKLTPVRAAGAQNEFELTVEKTVDARMQGLENQCPVCQKMLPDWDRFCTRCAADLDAFGSGENPGHLLEDIRLSTAGQYRILGRMERSDGGGTVYFAEDLSRSKLVALRAHRTSRVPTDLDSLAIGETAALPKLAGELGRTKVVPLATSAAPLAAADKSRSWRTLLAGFRINRRSPP